MKTEILNYFKNDRSYSGGVALVIRYSKRLALKKQVNIQPESKYMAGVVHQELGELAGISPKELMDILKVPVAKIQAAPAMPEPVNENASEDPAAAKPAGKKPAGKKAAASKKEGSASKKSPRKK